MVSLTYFLKSKMEQVWTEGSHRVQFLANLPLLDTLITLCHTEHATYTVNNVVSGVRGGDHVYITGP